MAWVCFCRLALGHEKKTPLRIPVEALRNRPVGNTKRGKRIVRFPLQVSSYEISQVSTGDCFAALLKSSSSLRRPADFSPPYRFNCLWTSSFHFQFHDLRLVLLGHCGHALRARQSHEIPSIRLFIVLPFQHIVEKITEGCESRRQLFLH